MKISMTVDASKLQIDLTRTKVNVRRERRSIVRNEAEIIMQESLSQVPRDTNTLANSAFITEQADGSYAFGYSSDGEYNSKSKAELQDYMIRQHEDLALNHPNGGKAKFLEDPMTMGEEHIHQRIAKQFDRLFRQRV